MTHALDTIEDLIAVPYVAMVVFHYRLMRFVQRPMSATIEGLREPQWLAEFMLSGTLFLLGVLMPSGSSAVAFQAMMPIPLWSAWLLLIGGAHLISLAWGSRRSRRICATFEPWVYGTLLYTSARYSGAPRLAVATCCVSVVVSLLVLITLRDKNNGGE